MQRNQPTPRFTVVLQPSPADAPIVLWETPDPNQATLAFHEELRRLTARGATGELLMCNHHNAHIPILWLPLPGPLASS